MIVLPFRDKTPRLGSNVFVAENAALIGDVALGDDASVWFGCVLRADIASITIGARTNIQDNSVLHVDAGAPVVLGDEVTVGHSAVVHGCTVGRGALIGMGSSVLSGAVVGDFAVVGAGALVPEGMQIPPRSLAVGVPARVRRELTEAELQNLVLSWQHYVANKNEYLRMLSTRG